MLVGVRPGNNLGSGQRLRPTVGPSSPRGAQQSLLALGQLRQDDHARNQLQHFILYFRKRLLNFTTLKPNFGMYK